MSALKPGIYTAINVHDKEDATWPVDLPKLTAPEAERAVRRLWRWAMGSTFTGTVKLTSGRNHTRLTWDGNKRCIIVNPEEGWRDVVHLLSHWFDYAMNGETKHGKHHLRFETKMIKQVISRGWLEGKLKDREPKTNVVPLIDPKIAERQKKLASIEARMINWERKAKRAANALKKLTKQQRYYAKALAA